MGHLNKTSRPSNCNVGYVKLGLKIGQEYIAKDCTHLKNLRLYAHRGSKLILVQVTRLVREGNWKIVQMQSIFHVLFHGRSMLEYESLYDLFKSLNVPNNSSIH